MGQRSGSEKRRRYIKRSTGFTEEEYAEVRRRLAHTGLPFATLTRSALLGMPLPRARPTPSVHVESIARLLGTLGPLADRLRQIEFNEKKIGVNLNQLTHYAHLDKILENSLEASQYELQKSLSLTQETLLGFHEIRTAALEALGQNP